MKINKVKVLNKKERDLFQVNMIENDKKLDQMYGWWRIKFRNEREKKNLIVFF